MDSGVPELPVDPLAVLRKRRSAKWQTYPADVLPLTVAEMDFALAEPVAEALHEAVERSDAGYAMPVPGLGRALAGFAASRWNWDVDPASVTAVTDVGVGVVELLRLLARPGDAVVISPPVYPPFFDWVPEAGARLLEVPLAHDAAGWRLDLAALETAFATHPAAYVLCNPHNPVGRVHTADELAALVRLARIYQVTIVSDEIHGPLALPGATFTPLLTVPGAAELAVSVLSASKAWNLAGLKCAAVVTGSPAMAAAVAGLPPDSRWRVGHFGVLASIAAYTQARSPRAARGSTGSWSPSTAGGSCSLTCCASACPCWPGTRPRPPTSPGSTAPPSAQTTRPASGSSTAVTSRSSRACGSARPAAATRA